MKKIIFSKVLIFIKWKYSILILLLLVVLLGTGLRFYDLRANSFVADEFLDINSAYGYYKTHVWQAWDFNLGKPNSEDVFAPRDERAWLYKWQIAQLFKFFPPTESVARSVSVGWGIISIFIIYWSACYFTRKKSIGLISAFLFAVSVTAVAFDRKLRMYAMFYPLYLMLSLFLYKFFEEDYRGKIRLIKFISIKFGINVLYLIPLAIVAIASISIQLLTVNIIPVFLIYILIQILRLAQKKQFINKYSIVLMSASVIFLATLVLVPQKIIFYSGVLKFFINNQEYLLKVMQDYGNYILAFIFLFSGIYYLVREKMNKECLWLSISFFTPLLMAAFLWKRAQGMQYIFFLQPFLIILIASGIYFLAKFFEHNLQKFSKKSFFIAIFLALLILPDYSYYFSSDNTYKRDTNEVADYRKVFVYVKKNLKSGDVVITRHFRNYYLKGANVKIFDFGGERAVSKLSLAEVQRIRNKNQSGWIVLFDNDADDFISKEAVKYIQEEFTKIDNSQVRGASKAYRW